MILTSQVSGSAYGMHSAHQLSWKCSAFAGKAVSICCVFWQWDPWGPVCVCVFVCGHVFAWVHVCACMCVCVCVYVGVSKKGIIIINQSSFPWPSLTLQNHFLTEVVNLARARYYMKHFSQKLTKDKTSKTWIQWRMEQSWEVILTCMWQYPNIVNNSSNRYWIATTYRYW